MKVIHLTTVDQSGAGRAAMRIVRALKQYGVDTILLCLFRRIKDNPDTIQYITPRSTIWFRIAKKMRLVSTADQRRQKTFAPYSVKDGTHFFCSDSKVEQSDWVQNADIIHLHWIDQFIDIESLFSRTKQPIVWTLHDMGAFSALCNYYYYCPRYKEQCGKCPALGSSDEEDVSRQIWLHKKKLYRENLQRLFIVTCSHWLAACARESGLLKYANIRGIPNCIDTAVYKPVERKRDENIVRVMLGAVNAKDPNKGYERLVRIVERLVKEQDLHIEVLVVGHGSDNLPFSAAISVKSFGFVEADEDLAAIYNQADILLYGSYRDNLPNMIMEAMACGVPVVAFPIGGIPDMIEHKKTGYLAQSEDDYIAGIMYCLNNWTLLRNNARQKVLEQYSPNVVAEMYNDLYNEIYGNKEA